MSEDPIGFHGKDINLYRYVRNSPSKYNDPSGTEITFLGAFITGAIVGGIAGAVGEMIGNDNFDSASVASAAFSGAAAGAATVLGAGPAIIGAGVSVAGAAASAAFGLVTGVAVNLLTEKDLRPTGPAKPQPPIDPGAENSGQGPVQCGG